MATYFHLDHLGSTRVQTDQAGNVVTQMDYEPFGDYLEGAQGSEPYSYTGQRNDGGMGLYYYGARFYDPAIGRFITQDPAQYGPLTGEPVTARRVTLPARPKARGAKKSPGTP